MKRLWNRPGFRALLIGQTVSGVGDWLATIALMALVLDISGSSTAVGAVLVLRLLPVMVAGPLTTRVVKRWHRKRTMMAMDASRVVIVALIPLLHALWWVYVWAFVLEAAGLVFLPARDSAIPDLAGDEDLELANGLALASSYGTIPIGAGIFGIVSMFLGKGRTGTSVAFFIDAATFVVSFLAIRSIKLLDERDRKIARAEERGEQEVSFVGAFKLPLIRRLIVPAGVAAIGLGTLFSTGIVFVRKVMHAGDSGFAVLILLFGIGAAAGLVLLRIVAPDAVAAVRWAVLGQGVVIAGMSLAPSLGIAFAGALLFGAATSITLTSAMSALQERLADDERIMAFAAFHTVIRGGLSVAAILAGLATDALHGVRWPVIGHLPGARVVLLGAGLITVLASVLIKTQAPGPAQRDGTARRDRPSHAAA
ncbi:MAG TPA: MFS transporter [Acidimicrobiia bacterium]|nr:MFS transporter [Acidimicrobiia bacterium]